MYFVPPLTRFPLELVSAHGVKNRMKSSTLKTVRLTDKVTIAH